jgi:hypothetical protein
MYALGYLVALLPCGLLLFGVAALLAIVDARTLRGYALRILSSLLLGCTIAVVVTVTILDQMQPPQPVSIHNSGFNIWLFFYFVPAVYAAALVLMTGAIEAGIARHWRWIVGFVVAAVVPVLLAVPPHPFLDMNTEWVVQQAGFLGMLIAPAATALANSSTHRVRPIASAPVSQGAPQS